MRAAIFEGAGNKLALRTIDDPTAGPNEAVIKVGRCGICGTDVHMTSGHGSDFPSGSILGHEYAGEVVEIGAGVSNLKNGDLVTALPCTGCGKCAPCLAGAPLMYAQMQGYMGGFGQYMRIAAPSAIKLPASLSLMDGALVEPLSVGLHGVAMAQFLPGARVVVLGAGSVGLAAIFWARHLGAGKIVAASRSARRADIAAQLGADGFVQFGEGEGERAAEILGGPPDVVFEAAGAVGMLGKAIELVCSNGLIVSLGFCASPDPILPSFATWKQVRIAFSMGYTLQEFQYCADVLAAGHLQPRAMVSETIGLDALPDALEQLRAGSNQTKVHVESLGMSNYAGRKTELLEAAARATGLSDFGKDDYSEGLELFLHCLDTETTLTPEGEAMTLGHLQMFLESRLYSEAGWKRYPETLNRPILAPLIITGIVRSGTTALHRLMSIDPQFQGLEHWLAWAPQPRPPRAQWEGIPAYRKVKTVLDAMIAGAPEMADDHMMSAEGVEESMFLLPQTFCNNTFPAQWNVPTYDAWYRKQDETPSYARLARNFQLIGANEFERRWLLKNPADARGMNAVLNVHPDALIVQTHRDPIQAIPSVVNLITAARRLFEGEHSPAEAVAERETRFWAEAVNAATAARHRTLKPVFNLEFNDFVRDQLGAVKAIYAHFGLQLTPETERGMQAWLDRHPRKSTTLQRFTPEDFGVQTGEMRELYADYRAARGYK